MGHLKQGSSTLREGKGGCHQRGPKNRARVWDQAKLRWPLIPRHSVDVEVIDGAGSRISG